MSRMQYSLIAFSKYNRESPLDTFVIINEASLCGITDKSILMRSFPLFMIGKALIAQAKLR